MQVSINTKLYIYIYVSDIAYHGQFFPINNALV